MGNRTTCKDSYNIHLLQYIWKEYDTIKMAVSELDWSRRPISFSFLISSLSSCQQLQAAILFSSPHFISIFLLASLGSLVLWVGEDFLMEHVAVAVTFVLCAPPITFAQMGWFGQTITSICNWHEPYPQVPYRHPYHSPNKSLYLLSLSQSISRTMPVSTHKCTGNLCAYPINCSVSTYNSAISSE